MDFMKVFDQTVREIKREVNLKVLKVPEIEQKVLDATSDEPWGPHGSALSELAQATKKFAECQMVMNVLWTRLGERGANWRHVYKALTIIEYLIANGSERAVDDILDHYSKISVLSSFEYVEPNGKDAGINVRKKVETIVGILNDKERIKAVRDKAASNRDK
jgi:epsin